MLTKKILILGFIVFALMLGGYYAHESIKEGSTETSLLQEDVKIQADREAYTPTMSSTVGIGLTPAYTTDEDNQKVRFRWQTNYGYFLRWNPPDYKVRKLGTEVVNDGEKIYWSYDPNDVGTSKPRVRIVLKVGDPSSSQVLAESTLELDWVSQDTVRVGSSKLL